MGLGLNLSAVSFCGAGQSGNLSLISESQRRGSLQTVAAFVVVVRDDNTGFYTGRSVPNVPTSRRGAPVAPGLAASPCGAWPETAPALGRYGRDFN
jgi:hypothetical protein